MAKEVDEFLNELNGKPENEVQNDDPLNLGSLEKEEQPQEEVKSEELEEEKPLPFHKDPKIQRYVQREISKALEGLTPKQESVAREKITNAESEDDLVAAFTQIIGNDTPEKVHALRMLERGLKNIEEKALSGQRQIEQERLAESKAERELENGLVAIEESFDVDITSRTPQAKKTRAEFLDFIERIAPKDAKGNITDYPDFTTSFELFVKLQEKQNPTTSKAKELASRSMARSSDASTAPKPQGNSWADVDRFFSKLEDR